ncbi:MULTISPECIES: aldehyde dehydrogenase family protein [Niveispirillum]|uniref:Aldehyde dehydrogenase n=2 Tax=Niveispirillum TaxID=1543704 RepID=A0A255Z6H9_9PROT|nr:MULTISPECIES: aldehyde dehydrogenase family protein [Niveispirillum]AUN31032.1 aldehyde dehydrogenase [Niveispirillum cyanobacteriorum]OYQ37078.1 aldehyde dehydrogenase [Niveispirillum lacus]GGE88029.1 aldehyde dehydrogenase [Niveispirillum cyanobacteriorum]
MNGNFALTIDGRQVAGSGTFEVRDPATGAVVATAPAASADQLDAAVGAARKAFPGWAARSEADRKAVVANVADIIEAHAAELAELVTREQGKPLAGLGSQWEIGGAIAWARHTASLDLPMETIQDDAGGRVTLHRRPIGVVGSITPWNFPVMIAIWHVMPAILAGNTVVLKPSPNTPLATLLLGQLLQEALPPGVLNVIAGADGIGQAMADHKGIDKIVFTGSTTTGRKVMASGAANLKRLTLELGGNDAGIVLPDADLDAHIDKLFWGIFINNGQTCAALKRLYVHDSLYDAVCDRLVAYAANIVTGNGLEPDSRLGPVQNPMQFDRVKRLVEQARQAGARVLCGGEPAEGPGLFYPVTILADAYDGMDIVDEEQFGPAVPIIRFTDIEDVIARANASESGLGGSIWSRDLEKARALAARLECGSVWINNHGAIRPDAPFGGVKQSGIGLEFASLGLAEFTSVQVIHS